MSRSRPLSKHVFVSPSGKALPRWLQAFPSASILLPGSIVSGSYAGISVWLHLDRDLPSVEQFARMQKLIPEARVIVLASEPDNEDALALFSAGARAYCNAHATAANLRQVAKVVQAGGLWIGEALMQRLITSTRAALSQIEVSGLTQASESQVPRNFLSELTKREIEVARAVASGSSNKEVARQLNITERTVKAHVGAVFRKLDARDRLHLALIVNGHCPA